MDRRFSDHLAPHMSGGLGGASLPRPRSPGFDFILDDSRRSRLTAGPPQARYAGQAHPFGDAFGRPAPSSSKSSLPPPNAPAARLSLPRPGLYDAQHQEARNLSHADDYHKIKRNLHQDVRNSQYAAPTNIQELHRLPIHPPSNATSFVKASSLFSRQDGGVEQSPLTQIANAMLNHQSLPQARSMEPVSFFWQQQRRSQINQLQPQQQQVTPPFHQGKWLCPASTARDLTLKAALHEAEEVARSSSPMPIPISSPSERISTRRSVKHPLSTQAQTRREFYNGQLEYAQYSENSQHSTPNRPTNAIVLPHAPPMVRGIQLISTHELPDRLRQIFPYDLFNAIQSRCFFPVYHTNDNIVVSAPTGGGKTAILELAICRLVDSHPSKEFKIIYQAPTKALCSERLQDWRKKFRHLDLACAELTGDTGHNEMATVRNATIIVTTPEKWDSITRKWSDHDRLVAMVKLFLIDEVHILRDTRGATLEAVVSRMRQKNSEVRFVALSATVPNTRDIATWLGKNSAESHHAAHLETFEEDFRPVKLQKFVHGYESNTNDFAFDSHLDSKILNIIAQYSCGKPILVFCFTRKSCEATARLLAEWWSRQKPRDRAWPTPTRTIAVQNKQLQDAVNCGVAFHHAGLDLQDREAIAHSYLRGEISLICCTSTLAVGVNLPCHLVVLKGTVGFQNGILEEYPDLEVMQMLGRAGRPQFDDSAIAVILTRRRCEDRYKKMVTGQQVVESTLHLNLIEHLNSEICLQTVHTIASAKDWVKGTFLNVRIMQNPRHYKLEGVPESENTDRRLELVCERDIGMLRELQLITEGEDFRSTEYGQIMSRYMIQFETMKLFLAMPPKAKTEKILQTVCQAVELKDIRIKPVERPHLREINKSPFIKYPIKENISTTSHKIMLLVQIHLGGIESLNEKEASTMKRQFATDTKIALDRLWRLIRALIECKAYERDAISVRHGLDLARGLCTGLWENSNLQLQQLHGLGPAAVRRFATHKITSIEALRKKDTADIERIMSKNPPYGRKLLDQLATFPQLQLSAKILRQTTGTNVSPKVHVLATLSFRNKTIPVWKTKRPALTLTAERTDGLLLHFWRGPITKLEKGGHETKFIAEICGPDDEITCYLSCEDIVATTQSCILRPQLPQSAFPTRSSTLPAETDRKQPIRQRSITSTTSDDFDCDIDDEDLLEAVEEVDVKERNSDEFEDIDNFEQRSVTKEKTTIKDKDLTTEPYLLPNGRWSCNHACGGGQLLKNGKPCKHKCCAEGLDKPRKPKISSNAAAKSEQKKKRENKRTNSNELAKKKGAPDDKTRNKPHGTKITGPPSIKLANTWHGDSDFDSVELFDLTNDDFLEQPLGIKADRHKSPYTDSPEPPDEQSREEHLLPESDGYALSVSDDVHDEIEYDDFDMMDDDFDFQSPSFTLEPQMLSNEFDEAMITVADTCERENKPGGVTAIETCNDLLPIHVRREPMEMTSTPNRASSSFVNAVFDFDAYEHKFESPPSTTTTSTCQTIPEESPPAIGTKKRERSQSPYHQLGKRREVQKPDVEEASVTGKDYIDNSSLPLWVNEFDSELIEGLKGFVDFVD